MIYKVLMPTLGSTTVEGKIVSWVKALGEKVEKGETIAIVESDRADIDVNSCHEGYLAAITVPPGDFAPVGFAIAFLAQTEAEIEQAKQQAASWISKDATSHQPQSNHWVQFKDQQGTVHHINLNKVEEVAFYPSIAGKPGITIFYSSGRKLEFGGAEAEIVWSLINAVRAPHLPQPSHPTTEQKAQIEVTLGLNNLLSVCVEVPATGEVSVYHTAAIQARRLARQTFIEWLLDPKNEPSFDISDIDEVDPLSSEPLDWTF
jgi:pyruvate/2-oxoglutarate dehydrogenase complex dihydrolipoamide acyltransferase (E2) component